MTLHRCPSCTYHARPISGNGPVPCSIALLGEGPAKDECRRGYPFAGRAGMELDNQYLPLARLPRPSVYVSNVTKCPFPGFRNPTKEEALSCARAHLSQELREVAPKVIVTLGAIAASVFDFPSLDRPVNLELDHGLPLRAGFGGWEGWLIPMYHPAAGMRQSRFMLPLREDFTILPGLIEALLQDAPPPLPVDPYPSPHYEEITSPVHLAEIIQSEWEPYQDGPAIDTESDGARTFSWQVCFTPGRAYFIDARNHALNTALQSWLDRDRPLVILHHALHDLDALLNLDPPARVPRWVDTMMLAFHAQEFSMGLKPLAHRLLGMSMQDYEDVVLPHSLAAVENHAIDVVSSLEREFMRPHVFKSGKRKGQSELRFPPSTPPDVRDTLNRYRALLRDIGSPSRPEDFDPWKRYSNWKPEVRVWGEVLWGEFPRSSIAHVPRREAIHYACRDADATLRLLPLLRRRARLTGREVLEAAR